MLGLALVVAFLLMRDLGFKPRTDVSTLTAVRDVTRGSIDGGLRNRPVRWMMLAAPFTAGVSFYAFYAMQPYLLELFGDPTAYSIAGLAAAIVAAAQIVGGLSVPLVRRFFRRRTDALLLGVGLNVVILLGIGAVGGLSEALGRGAFVLAIVLLVAWALTAAISAPIRSAFLNGCIASEQRATVLSFDSLMGSLGGVVAQPVLGRVADVSGYAASYLVAAGISALSLPFVFLARRAGAIRPHRGHCRRGGLIEGSTSGRAGQLALPALVPGDRLLHVGRHQRGVHSRTVRVVDEGGGRAARPQDPGEVVEGLAEQEA
jgi:MFS family permease